MIDRLGEVLPPQRAGELRRYLADVDPAVRNAAAKAFDARTGAAGSSQDPWKRYPFQPSEGTMTSLPKTAEIRTDGGAFDRDGALRRSGARDDRALRRSRPRRLLQRPDVPSRRPELRHPGRQPRRERVRRRRALPARRVGVQRRTSAAPSASPRAAATPATDRSSSISSMCRGSITTTPCSDASSSGLDVVDKILEGAKITTITVK